MSPSIADRIADVRARIDAAIARRGPGPDVTLCAVSKRHPPHAVRQAAAAGLRDFGENYPQQLHAKREALADLPALRWHAIGPVQSNKVKLVLGCALVHTVDRTALVERLERAAAAGGVQQRVLVQVDIADEAGKSGAAASDVPALLDAFASCSHVRCVGLMLIPPLEEPEAARRWFHALRSLRDDLAATARPNVTLHELSMGMSADFEIAIEEGASIVRVGTAIFGERG